MAMLDLVYAGLGPGLEPKPMQGQGMDVAKGYAGSGHGCGQGLCRVRAWMWPRVMQGQGMDVAKGYAGLNKGAIVELRINTECSLTYALH